MKSNNPQWYWSHSARKVWGLSVLTTCIIQVHRLKTMPSSFMNIIRSCWKMAVLRSYSPCWYTDQRLYNHAVSVHFVAMNQDDTVIWELSQRLTQTYLVFWYFKQSSPNTSLSRYIWALGGKRKINKKTQVNRLLGSTKNYDFQSQKAYNTIRYKSQPHSPSDSHKFLMTSRLLLTL